MHRSDTDTRSLGSAVGHAALRDEAHRDDRLSIEPLNQSLSLCDIMNSCACKKVMG